MYLGRHSQCSAALADLQSGKYSDVSFPLGELSTKTIEPLLPGFLDQIFPSPRLAVCHDYRTPPVRVLNKRFPSPRSRAHSSGAAMCPVSMVNHGEVVLEFCIWRGCVQAGKTYALSSLFTQGATWRLQLKAIYISTKSCTAIIKLIKTNLKCSWKCIRHPDPNQKPILPMYVDLLYLAIIN